MKAWIKALFVILLTIMLSACENPSDDKLTEYISAVKARTREEFFLHPFQVMVPFRYSQNYGRFSPFQRMNHSMETRLGAAMCLQRTTLHSELLHIVNAKASDIAELLKAKDSQLLSERGSLSVDKRINAIWIHDTGERLEQIRGLIKQLDVPLQQVLIEARIVNVTKDFAKDIGLRFGLARSIRGSASLTEASAGSQRVPKDTTLVDRLNFDFVTTAITAAPISLALASLGDNILLDLELSALESEGQGEILSSPRIIAANRQTAVIESGEEVPYQETVGHGATAVTFKKAVLSLKATPHITSDNKILLDLKINQDTLSPKVFNGVPSILTKEIQTQVLINDGQTIVLGGIYKQNKNNTVNRVPLLGELPVVKTVFRNQITAIRNEELLIFITPRIIADNLPLAPKGQRQALAKFTKLYHE